MANTRDELETLERRDAEQSAEWERVRENLAAIAAEFIEANGPDAIVAVEGETFAKLEDLTHVDTVPACPPPFPRVRG